MNRALLLLLPCFVACSHPRIAIPVAEEAVPPGKDEARVVVYRPSFRNASKSYAFFDDEEMLGFSQSGSWFEVRCSPGPHFFYLRGVSDAAVMAELVGGKTYFLRVDSVPQFLHLQLQLVPVGPGSEDFAEVDEVVAGLERREAVDLFVDDYEERFAEQVTERLAYFRNEGKDECARMRPEDGR